MKTMTCINLIWYQLLHCHLERSGLLILTAVFLSKKTKNVFDQLTSKIKYINSVPYQANVSRDFVLLIMEICIKYLFEFVDFSHLYFFFFS